MSRAKVAQIIARAQFLGIHKRLLIVLVPHVSRFTTVRFQGVLYSAIATDLRRLAGDGQISAIEIWHVERAAKIPI